MTALKLTLIALLFTGCASHSTHSIIDITDDQWIEDARGNRCIDKQMLIYPDRIVYFYPECGVRRVVKPKPHILPKPYDNKKRDLTKSSVPG